ncbi:MAG: hypothetical protein IJ724_01865, partial [Muribaculaceae bacterium]|nr:hypothetical protein [Muribaculaceae bacterium]
CANNPMRYTDLDGKRILIQDGIDRDLFMKSMSTVFGNYSNYFEFDTNGFLSYNGSLVGMSSLQLDLFAGLNEIIEQDDVTQVVAGKEMILQDVEGNQLAFSTERHGGELKLLMDEVEGIDRNFVLVNPMDNQTIQVMTLVNDFGVGSNTSKSIKYENVQATPTDLIFHGLGHVKYKGQSQDKVIKFHNKARKILNLPSWPSNDYRHGKGYK